jgi:starvation-inducible outer membrane lipoprotein
MAAAWPILPLLILQPMRRQGLTPRHPLTLNNTTMIQRVRMGGMVLNRSEAHITIPIEVLSLLL